MSDRTTGACRIGVYIPSFLGDLVFRFVGDVFCLQAAVAGDSGSQVSAHGVGHVFGSRVHQVLSRIGNHSVFSGILDIRSSQVGGGGVLSISYSNRSFSCILSDGGVLVLSVHCFVFCFVFHVEGVAIADHASGDVLLGVVW